MNSLWIRAAVALLVPVPFLLAESVPESREQPADVRPVAAELAPAPSERLLHNDPRTRPHAISDALVRDIDGVPAGEHVDVTTYWISSGRIADALVRAHRRGVRVRVLLDGSPRSRTPEAARIERELARTPGDGSWLRRTGHAARGDEGIMHEKTFRLSRTGDERWVVVTGSWNAADTSDTGTYAAMWRVAGHRDIHDAFAEVSRSQRDRQREARPLRRYAGPGWSAYFLPAGHDAEGADPRVDPVLEILRRVPAARSSRVRVAMYSMWDGRAAWLAAELARISRGGGQVVMVAGPTVDDATRATLVAAGARVVEGCYRDGTFVHGKDMALRYVSRGEVRHWTWVGSDNWTSRGMASDQAALGIEGEAAHRQFVSAFAPLVRRTDGVSPDVCEPRTR